MGLAAGDQVGIDPSPPARGRIAFQGSGDRRLGKSTTHGHDIQAGLATQLRGKKGENPSPCGGMRIAAEGESGDHRIGGWPQRTALAGHQHRLGIGSSNAERAPQAGVVVGGDRRAARADAQGGEEGHITAIRDGGHLRKHVKHRTASAGSDTARARDEAQGIGSIFGPDPPEVIVRHRWRTGTHEQVARQDHVTVFRETGPAAQQLILADVGRAIGARSIVVGDHISQSR